MTKAIKGICVRKCDNELESLIIRGFLKHKKIFAWCRRCRVRGMRAGFRVFGNHEVMVNTVDVDRAREALKKFDKDAH